MTPELILGLILQGMVTGGKLMDQYNRAKAGEVVTKEEVDAVLTRAESSVDAYEAAVAANRGG